MKKRQIALLTLFILLVLSTIIYVLTPGIRLEMSQYEKIYDDGEISVYFNDPGAYSTVTEDVASRDGKNYTFIVQISNRYVVLDGMKKYSLKEAIEQNIVTDTQLVEVDFLVPINIE